MPPAWCSSTWQWISQRPGLDPCNYDRTGYLADSRTIQRQRRDARELLRAVQLRDSITGDMLAESFRAFSGRLQWDGEKLTYCTGQYWPTEYRAAACAVLADCLWYFVRGHAMPEPTTTKTGDTRYDGVSAGDWLRRYFRREFGRGIQSRWFD